MRGFFLSGLTLAGVAAVLTAVLATGAFCASAQAQSGGAADLAAQCRRVRNDDAVRPYAPALDSQLRAAFTRLFPGAQKPVGEQEVRAGANVRCMDGRLYACFVGANLPCSKMSANRRNVGAANFCKQNPNSAVVPMVATGHDSVYSYRCRGGRAIVSGATYKLDRRGFAANLWTPLD